MNTQAMHRVLWILLAGCVVMSAETHARDARLDKIFREIAWKAVVEHPLSGVTDKNKNGIGDHLE